MKTWLLLSRMLTGRLEIHLHAFENYLPNGSSDFCGDRALFRRVLNPRHPIRLVFSNLAVFSMYNELSRAVSLDTFPGGGNGFLLCRKGPAGFTFLLKGPSSVGTIDVNRLYRHVFIVRAYLDACGPSRLPIRCVLRYLRARSSAVIPSLVRAPILAPELINKSTMAESPKSMDAA